MKKIIIFLISIIILFGLTGCNYYETELINETETIES